MNIFVPRTCNDSFPKSSCDILDPSRYPMRIFFLFFLVHLVCSSFWKFLVSKSLTSSTTILRGFTTYCDSCRHQIFRQIFNFFQNRFSQNTDPIPCHRGLRFSNNLFLLLHLSYYEPNTYRIFFVHNL